ncbi:MAG: RcnB family protein [Hyphomonadaceae bacterium]
MKRLAGAVLAAAAFAAPMAIVSTAAADPPRHSRGWDRHDRDYDNRDDRRDERRAYRRGYRDGDRDDRRADRWDDRRYNGYWRQGRFYHGPPPRHYRDVRYDYRAWRRGDRLPSYYRNHYRPIQYDRYRLRPPPRGYHYVRRDDTGEILLLGIATGAILGVILAGS